MKDKENNIDETGSAKSGDATEGRRKFLKGSLAAAAGTAAAGFPMIGTAAGKPTVLKLQGAWGGGIFKEFA